MSKLNSKMRSSAFAVVSMLAISQPFHALADDVKNGEAFRVSAEVSPAANGYSIQVAGDQVTFSGENNIVAINNVGHYSQASAWVNTISSEGRPDALAGGYTTDGPRAFFGVRVPTNFQPGGSTSKEGVWSALNISGSTYDWTTFSGTTGRYAIDAEAGTFQAILNSGVQLVGQVSNGKVTGTATKAGMQGTFEGYCGANGGQAVCYGGFSGASETGAFSGVWR